MEICAQNHSHDFLLKLKLNLFYFFLFLFFIVDNCCHVFAHFRFQSTFRNTVFAQIFGFLSSQVHICSRTGCFSLFPKAWAKMLLDLTVMSKEYCRLFVESLLLQKEHISALCPFASPALPKLSNFLRILFN